MATKVATFPLRLPVSLRSEIERLSEEDATSMNQFLVVAAAEKISRIQTARFFEERRSIADREMFRRLLNREGGEPPRPDDQLPEGWVSTRFQTKPE